MFFHSFTFTDDALAVTITRMTMLIIVMLLMMIQSNQRMMNDDDDGDDNYCDENDE